MVSGAQRVNNSIHYSGSIPIFKAWKLRFREPQDPTAEGVGKARIPVWVPRTPKILLFPTSKGRGVTEVTKILLLPSGEGEEGGGATDPSQLTIPSVRVTSPPRAVEWKADSSEVRRDLWEEWLTQVLERGAE